MKRAIGTLHAQKVERLRSLLARGPGRTPTLILHGAAGVGHGDIVTALRNELADDALLVEGSCSAGPAGPYRPFQHIAVALQNALDGHAQAAARSLLVGPLDSARHASQVQALLGEVRVRDARKNHMESVRRVLAELSTDRQLVVVVHDVHQADHDTRALVDYLLADASGSAAVGIGAVRSRPTLVLTLDEDSPDGRGLLDELKGRDDVECVALERLDAEGLAQVVREPAVSEKLLRVTEGLPHKVRMLAHVLPNDLGALIDARLRGLPHDAIAVLRFARLFGAPLSPGALSVLTNISQLIIQRMRVDGLLSDAPDSTRQQPLITVASAWLDAEVLESEDPADNAKMHRRCAEHLSARIAVGDSAELHERIANHLLSAGDIDAAVEHVLAASVWLEQNSALTRAAELVRETAQRSPDERLQLRLVELEVTLGHFEVALEHCKDLTSGGDITVLAQQARIHSLSGDIEAAETALVALRARELPAAMRDVADTLLADVLLKRGNLDGATRLCEERLATGGFQDEMAAVRLRHTLGKLAFWRADWAGAEGRYQEVLDTLPAHAGAERTRALVLHNLGLVSLRLGRYNEASRRIQQGLALLDSLGEHFDAAVCGHNLGLAHEYCQRYGMAIQLFERSIDVLERFGNRVNLAGAINSLGDVYLTLGEAWRARKLFEYSLSVSEAAGLTYFVAFNTMRLAQVELLEGGLERAGELANRALVAFGSLGHAEELSEAHLVRAMWAARSGDDAGALADLAAAEAGASNEVAARATTLRARLLITRRPAMAHRLAVEAASQLTKLGQRDGVVSALTEAALAARAAGQAHEAATLLQRAQASLAELRDRVPAANHDAFDSLPMVRRLTQAATPDVVPASAAADKRSLRALPRKAPARSRACEGMVGESPAMQRVFAMVERLGDCDAPILIIGESGTGKERVAEAICNASPRINKPFIRVNAAAFADTLLESELFGHEKGAFTGAVARKLGAFEQADGGTLFLDEIGDISPKTQVSLLRVLQEREFRRVGGRKPIKVDVRILCATNRDLEKMVAEGSFRLDLYYRVKGLTVDLPALRDRTGDLTLLSDFLLDGLEAKHGNRLHLEPAAKELLERYRWPGNVRELENVLRSVYFFAQGDRITADDLTNYTLLKDARPEDMGANDLALGGQHGTASADAPLSEGFNLNDAKRELEIRCIDKAMLQADGNITQAAKLLGMKRPRLSQKIKEYRLKVR